MAHRQEVERSMYMPGKISNAKLHANNELQRWALSCNRLGRGPQVSGPLRPPSREELAWLMEQLNPRLPRALIERVAAGRRGAPPVRAAGGRRGRGACPACGSAHGGRPRPGRAAGAAAGAASPRGADPGRARALGGVRGIRRSAKGRPLPGLAPGAREIRASHSRPLPSLRGVKPRGNPGAANPAPASGRPPWPNAASR